MPKGDPAGYLPNVQAAREQGGRKRFGKKGKGKSAPIQKSLRAGSQRSFGRPAK